MRGWAGTNGAGVKCSEPRFIISAVRPELFPAEELPEVAFLGRSNVGKSTLLNVLAGVKGLAHTSASPGRTQGVNFFRVQDQWCFVDLPGYGYARVPLEIKDSWKALIEAYLGNRRKLALCFLLLDARRGWMEKDLELCRWLEIRGRRYIVIATKFDKLKTQKERHHQLAQMGGRGADAAPIPFSAITGQGVREIWQAIMKIQN
ncbi:MAG: YihA family ribosome biogenesis GTP-binding protein [Acidobacteriia bacterium]|nr:YihA family ribosome biogenesis GTP-binding protein [Terriglobia bacterium]